MERITITQRMVCTVVLCLALSILHPTGALIRRDSGTASSRKDEQLPQTHPHPHHRLHTWPSSYNIANGEKDITYQGESITVYSRPMTTKYAEVYNERQDPIPLPEDIVARFKGKIMAVTGYEIDVVQINEETNDEMVVSSKDYYNHHYILGLKSSMPVQNATTTATATNHTDPPAATTPAIKVPADGGSRQQQPLHHRVPLPLTESHHPEGGGSLRGSIGPSSAEGEIGGEGQKRRFSNSTSKAGADLISPQAENIPLISVFCEGNGGEYRGTFHGYASGYAQLIESPAYFWPFQLHFINTRASVGRLVPKSSLAPPNALYSGLIECPCTTRRDFDLKGGKIDGDVPVPFNCEGELLDQNNSVCSLETYVGGFRCCEGGMVLLDVEQEQPKGKDTYVLKVRFWYEAYHQQQQPQQEEGVEDQVTEVIRVDQGARMHASHLHAFRLYIQTERWAGEYDVPACLPHQLPDQCDHVLTTIMQVKDLFSDCSFRDNKDCADSKALAKSEGVRLVYAAGHMHIGGLSLELYDADSGLLICRNTPIYESRPGHEEEGHISSIRPCVWGHQEGLRQSPLLKPATRLLSIARYNASVGHYGVMASWQMRGVLTGKEEK